MLVRHQRQGQMGHLPAVARRRRHAPGAGLGPVEHPQQREEGCEPSQEDVFHPERGAAGEQQRQPGDAVAFFVAAVGLLDLIRTRRVTLGPGGIALCDWGRTEKEICLVIVVFTYTHLTCICGGGGWTFGANIWERQLRELYLCEALRKVEILVRYLT